MPPVDSWLTKLNLRQLHRLAALVGSPCSGTKATRIQEIQNAVNEARWNGGTRTRNKPLSIVSIDMGIRNLAYCHFQTYLNTSGPENEPIKVSAWKRLSMEETDINQIDTEKKPLPGSKKTPAVRESYHPAIYARRAHGFVKQMIDSHQPTHVLIERQRFRSGGQAAVQEWTIRVGVFEAMLYAVFATLLAERHYNCQVIPILPKQVNRYWLESHAEDEPKRMKATASAVKMQKIGCVETLLAADGNASNLSVSEDATLTKSAFLSISAKQRTRGSGATLKLDDLSDSFLQGLAWIHWQNNRLRVDAKGAKAFGLG
jgi:cruciform cutting endonuclease 1